MQIPVSEFRNSNSLLVMPDKYQKGIGAGPEDPNVRDHERYEWESVLHTHWASDAHTVGYSRALQPLEARRYNMGYETVIGKTGDSILMDFIFIDVDLPNHREWESELEKAEMLAKCIQLPGVYADWCAWYSTQHGYRIVYKVTFPYTIQYHEAVFYGVARDLASHGILADPICSDWTRLYRLPNVVRGDSGTSAECMMLVRPDTTFNVQAIEAMSDRLIAARKASASASRTDVPEYGEHEFLLMGIDGRPSNWFKYAKERLQGSEYYRHIFDHEPIPAGERDVTLAKMVGAVINRTKDRVIGDATTKEHVWALLEGVAQSLEAMDPGGDNWRYQLWRKVERFWTQHLFEREQMAEIFQAQHHEKQQQLMQTAAASNMLAEQESLPDAHVDVRDLTGDEAEALRARAVLAFDNFYFTLRPDGLYTTGAVSPRNLIAHIRHQGIEGLIPLTREKVTPKGEVIEVKRSAQEIIDDHALPVHEIRARFTNRSGGMLVRDHDTHKNYLDISPYVRVSGFGEFDKDVDLWLHALFGDQYDWGCNWLANSLALEDGPICALSMAGPGNSGKSLLVAGLAECFSGNLVAGPEIFNSAYSGRLLQTPIIAIEEGGISDRSTAPSEMFRHLVTGGSFSVNEKYKPNVTIKINLRVVLTANNPDLLRALVAPRGLSQHDRDAVLQRIRHLDIDNKASKLFAEKGGNDWTRQKGREWIGVRPGQLGRVAKHIQWLYQNRRRPESGRMLVNGNLQDQALADMLTAASGRTSYVYEALVDLVSQSGDPRTKKLMFAGNMVYFSSSAILQQLRSGTYGVSVNQNDVRRAIEAVGEPNDKRRLQAVCPHSGTTVDTQGRFYSVPLWWLDTQIETIGNFQARQALRPFAVAANYTMLCDRDESFTIKSHE